MNCREFLALLDAEGGELEPSAREHAESCAQCARARERTLAVRRELRAMGDDEPADFLAERVMARVRAESRHAAPAGWRLRPAIATAAAVAVAAAGFVLWGVLRGPAAPVQEARSETSELSPPDSRRSPAAASVPEARPATALVDKRDRREASRPAPALPSATPAAAPPAVARQAPAASPSAAVALAAGAENAARGNVDDLAAPRAARESAMPELTGEAKAAQELDASGEAATTAPEQRRAAASAGAAHAGVVLTSSASEQPPSRPEEQELEAGGIGAARAKGAGHAAAPPVMRALQAAADADETPVEVVPIGRANGPRLVVRVPAVLAPPRGQRWTVRVAADGAVTLLDAAGRDAGAAHAPVVAVLRAAGLAAGEYALQRPPR